MLKNTLYVERLKLKRSKLWLLYIIGPLLGVLLAYINFLKNYDLFMQPGDNEWIEAWTQAALFMGPFILPILVGIYAAFICREEHVGGGWKQLFTLPIKHSAVFLGKFLIVIGMVTVTMLLLFIFFVVIGYVKGIEGSFPIFMLLGFVVKGILACLPLIVLQLIISIRAKTFGVPLAVSIVFTLPAIIVASTPLGQIYPWTQPMLAMSPEDESPIQSYGLFYTLLIGSFTVLMWYGLRSLSKWDIS
ncbi:ABC transporter permease [Pseudobacillus badius]|uniref:ABC transporter permease n=1 Tax=Bacillus badius TaxID=1455 RepID=UPI003CEDBE1D